jgi:hypothetical protein
MAAFTPQAIELRDVVLPLVGLSNAGPMASRQTVQFMALHGLSSIDDFNLIEAHPGKRAGQGFKRETPCPINGHPRPEQPDWVTLVREG